MERKITVRGQENFHRALPSILIIIFSLGGVLSLKSRESVMSDFVLVLYFVICSLGLSI